MSHPSAQTVRLLRWVAKYCAPLDLAGLPYLGPCYVAVVARLDSMPLAKWDTLRDIERRMFLLFVARDLETFWQDIAEWDRELRTAR